MKNNLGKVNTIEFKNFLIIPLSKEWLSENNGRPLVFDAKLTLDGKLELCTQISKFSHNPKGRD